MSTSCCRLTTPLQAFESAKQRCDWSRYAGVAVQMTSATSQLAVISSLKEALHTSAILRSYLQDVLFAV